MSNGKVHRRSLKTKKQPEHLIGISGNKKPRTHGKPWMYTKRACWPACLDCYNAYIKENKKRVYLRDTGRAGTLLDAAPTQEKIRKLLVNRNYSIAYISRETGLHINSIRRLSLTDKPSKWVHSNTAKKIDKLYEQSHQPQGNTYYKDKVDPRTSRLAIQGLMVQGWTQKWIGEQIGVSKDAISNLSVRGRQRFVKPEIEASLVELAKRVGSDEGPSAYIKNFAKKRGYVPTMMWDDFL